MIETGYIASKPVDANTMTSHDSDPVQNCYVSVSEMNQWSSGAVDLGDSVLRLRMLRRRR